jgi:hypothetical protein
MQGPCTDLLAFRALAELSSFRKLAESVHLSDLFGEVKAGRKVRRPE